MNQLFLVVFFGLALGAAFVFGAGFGVSAEALGRPRVPLSRIASRSALPYNPAEPIYLKGWIPFLLSLIFTADDEIPRACAISKTVIPSIYNNLNQFSLANQALNVEKLQHHYDKILKNVEENGYFDKFSKNVNENTGLLYKRIVVSIKIHKFLKIFIPPLDEPPWRGYIGYSVTSL